jgi:small conductance mechanosensitive channel
VLLLISVAGMVGIETTSFIAVLGAAGLAVGLALQGSLANFAGGVLILLFRPFKAGEFIEGGGVSGTVQEIQIFSTILKTGDNKVIIVPNGVLSNGTITNYSREARRRVDFVFGVSYDADLKRTREVLKGVLDADARIHADPEPLIVVSALGDNAVDFTVRAWVDAGDYWGVFFDTNEKAKEALDAAGIGIPYPQRDVHLYQHDT